MIEKHLVDKDNFFYCNTDHIRVYMPRKFFDSSLANVKGNYIETFGLLPVALCDKNGNDVLVEVMNCPYMINLYNSNTNVAKEKNFFKDDEIIDYLYVDFYRGEKIMKSTLVNTPDNIDVYLNYILGGKINNYIPYAKLSDTFDEVLLANGISLNVPHIVKEILLMVTCRDINKPENTYSLTIGKNPKASQYGYRAANNREIVSRSSISTAIGFEDMDSMIISGLNTTAYNKKQPESPIEKILTM